MQEALYLVSAPSTIAADREYLKRYISEQNADILLGNSYPTNIPFVDVRVLIGDPNYAFSCEVAEMLALLGVLASEPVLDLQGKQAKYKTKDGQHLVWNYKWGNEPFVVCSIEQLYAVGWDLRHHKGFVHLVSLCEERAKPVVEKTSSENNEEEEFPEDFDFIEFDL